MLTLTFSAAKGLDYVVPPEQEGLELEPEEAVLVEIRPAAAPALATRPSAEVELKGPQEKLRLSTWLYGLLRLAPVATRSCFLAAPASAVSTALADMRNRLFAPAEM